MQKIQAMPQKAFDIQKKFGKSNILVISLSVLYVIILIVQ